MAGTLLSEFTPVERVALGAIAEERPELVAVLRERLTSVLANLARTSQGRIVTEDDVEDLFLQARAEFAGRMMTELEPWEEDEDLRESAVDLLARHLLDEGRERFVRRVVGAVRN